MQTSDCRILWRTAAKRYRPFAGQHAQGATCHRGAASRQNNIDPPVGAGSLSKFCRTEFLENTAARKLFETASDSSDFLLRLSALAGKNLVPGKTLIFGRSAGVQRDRNCHKIFGGRGQLPLYLSGSLLGVELKDIRSAPVGYLDVLEMFPMRCITSTAKSRGNWTLSLSTRAMCCPLRSRAARTTRGTMPCLA